MTRALFAAALLAATALGAAAHAEDARLVERMYDANEVVRIDGKAGVQATIRFAEDEHIENVAIGDSQKWQVTPNKRANLLFVKPLSERATTNMTVVTDRHTYLFDLVASPTNRNPVDLRMNRAAWRMKRIAPRNSAGVPSGRPVWRSSRISAGAIQLLVGPASSLRSLQMKVRSSTRATSLGLLRAR